MGAEPIIFHSREGKVFTARWPERVSYSRTLIEEWRSTPSATTRVNGDILEVKAHNGRAIYRLEEDPNETDYYRGARQYHELHANF